MTKLSSLDMAIAAHYAEAILRPIRYGENGMFFWWPGSGIGTIVEDCFRSTILRKKYLGGLHSRIKVLLFWGQLTELKTAESLLDLEGFPTIKKLMEFCKYTVRKGNEVVCVVGRFDNYPENEKVTILRTFLRLHAAYVHRVHILIQSCDKPWFESLIRQNSEFLALSNTIEVMPVLSGKILEKYIETRAKEFGLLVSEKTKKYLIKTYGGILQLVKEYLRSAGRVNTLEVKLAAGWQALPGTYKDAIKQAKVLPDFKLFRVDKLQVFQVHRTVVCNNFEENLSKLLTVEEQILWKKLKANLGKVMLRHEVAGILRPSNTEDISEWAIDQAMSRFRKKLIEAGVDSDVLKTLKGKGYIWTG
jgi:hypothetical protein